MLLALVVGLACLALLWLLLGATRTALELWRELADLPLLLRLWSIRLFSLRRFHRPRHLPLRRFPVRLIP